MPSVTFERVAACGCDLGEGPVWRPLRRELLFTDIIGRRLLRWREGEGVAEAPLGERVGCFAPIAGEEGALLCAVEQGLERVEVDFAGAAPRREVVQAGVVGPDALLNDGGCDAAGRMVFGSKALNESDPIGVLLQYDGRELRVLREGLVIENGPVFSPAGDRIYFADTPKKEIYTAAYDATSGEMGAVELFATLGAEDGYPDGFAVDAEGGLWNAHWDGARVTRYRPDGQVDFVAPTPVSRPTSLCFGGADMRTLFITSAKRGRDDVEPLDEPMAGDLFAARAPFAGATCFDFQPVR